MDGFRWLLVEQIGLFAGNQVPERLELKPARLAAPNELTRREGGFPGDERGVADGFREELRVATAIHGDEPPGGFLHRVAHSQ